MLQLKTMSVSHVCTGITHAYNIDDPYHIGRIALHGIVKMIYIVCTCIHAVIAN